MQNVIGMFRSTLDVFPNLYSNKEKGEGGSSSSDSSVEINKDEIVKLKMDAIKSQMKIHNSRTKRIGIKYGELMKHDVSLSFMTKADKDQIEKLEM